MDSATLASILPMETVFVQNSVAYPPWVNHVQ